MSCICSIHTYIDEYFYNLQYTKNLNYFYLFMHIIILFLYSSSQMLYIVGFSTRWMFVGNANINNEKLSHFPNSNRQLTVIIKDHYYVVFQSVGVTFLKLVYNLLYFFDSACHASYSCHFMAIWELQVHRLSDISFHRRFNLNEAK